jgi:hypothetical protein
MANMVIPNEGKVLWATWAVIADISEAEDFVVDTYQNNYVPVDGSTAANFTVSSFGGYAQVAVDRNTFGTPTIVSNVAVTVSSATPTYSCTSGASQTAYGWFMRGASSGKVLAAAVFDVPWTMGPGAVITLNPFQIQLKTLV